MSDKKNDSNDPNDDEKKEESSKIAEPQTSGNHQPLKSRHFLQNSELIFGHIDKIYKRNPKEFASDKFDIYSPFFDLLNPQKALPMQTGIEKLIVKAVSTNLLMYTNPNNRQVIKSGVFDQKVSGFLYASLLTSAIDHCFDTASDLSAYFFNNNVDKLSTLKHTDIAFLITSPRKYEEYIHLKTLSRIVIHLSMSLEAFWKSDITAKLITTLQDFTFIPQFKVRNMTSFNSADSIVIYSTIGYEETWKQIGDAITQIIPKEHRENYNLPFAAFLDRGIVANINITYIPNKTNANPVETSFTGGLADLAWEAYKMLRSMDTSYVDDKLSIFQGILASIFKKNKLVVTEDGVLRQLERLGKK